MALGTDFADSYRFDPFVRTQANVVVMLITFSVLIVILFITLFEYAYRDVTYAIITAVRESILNGGTSDSQSTYTSLSTIRTGNIIQVTIIIGSISLIFAYLLMRVALSPTRSALVSQKQFIGNIAHELRTPLSSIKTNTEVALLSKNVQDDMQRLMRSTIEDVDRLANIINNLLSISASVRPERIEFSPIDTSHVAELVVQKLHSLAHTKHLDITLRKSDSSYVWGNAVALEQIIMNILRNAINHTPRGGHVSLTVEQVNKHVEVIVSDSGEGIARQDLFRIFDPFYRADASRNRAYGSGSGLGLTIVSELVKLHRGKITVRSALGHGTTVIVSIPSAHVPSSDTSIRGRRSFDEVGMDFSHKKIS